MAKNFGFCLPTRIEFGNGVLENLGTELLTRGFKTPLIVTDKSMIATGLVGKVEEVIKKTRLPYQIFEDTVPNPRDYDCDKGAAFAKSVEADVLVAIGGGSAMDTAKAMATVMTNGKTVRDWFDVELEVPSTPVICIPTTCGTGSEVTYNAVITNSETHLKGNIFDPKCAPILALVDPNMIRNLPSPLVASTGIDALTHAIEAYTCKIATPVTDAIAISAIKILSENLKPAVLMQDEEALSNVMLASMMAGIAFGNADTAGVHCIAECMGGNYDIPHGVTNAMFLADMSEYNIQGDPYKYGLVAAALGVNTLGLSDIDAAQKGIEKIRQLCAEIGIPKLREFEVVNAADFERLAVAAANHCCNPNNPRKAEKEDYLKIFNTVYSA